MQSWLLSGCDTRPCQRRSLVFACRAALPALKRTGGAAPESPRKGGVSVGVRVLYREVWGPYEDFSSNGEITNKIPELQTCISWDRHRVGAFRQARAHGSQFPATLGREQTSEQYNPTAPCLSNHRPTLGISRRRPPEGSASGGRGWAGLGVVVLLLSHVQFFATQQTAAQRGRVLIKRRAPHPHPLRPPEALAVFAQSPPGVPAGAAASLGPKCGPWGRDQLTPCCWESGSWTFLGPSRRSLAFISDFSLRAAGSPPARTPPLSH